MKTLYRPQPIYRLLAFASLVLVALFVWDLRDGVEVGALLFLSVCVGLCAWTSYMSLFALTVEETRFALHAPFAQDKIVDFGQIIDVFEEGRTLQTVVVNYHPRENSGLLDLDSAVSLNLPAMQNQEQLFSLLQEKTPQ